MELRTLKIYGLTGAPGCGKSTVLKLFSDLGRYTLDADSLCASIHNTPGGVFHDRIRERWGNSVLNDDGTTKKQKIAEIVFSDPSELKWLESELYPAITEQANLFFVKLPEDSVAIFEIPLLFERNWNIGLTGTIAVWSPRAATTEVRVPQHQSLGTMTRESLCLNATPHLTRCGSHEPRLRPNAAK